MRILVTGGAGFTGSALIRAAIAKGHSIINVDALTYAASVIALHRLRIDLTMFLNTLISEI